MQGQPVGHFFAIEIYAGTARLTASLRALGLTDSFGVDSVLPQRLNGPIIKLDLLNPSHLEHVKSLICNPACVYVHFAPPCGTASRARLIQNQQHTLPPPLRDDQRPNGLPWLTLEQQIRVDKANQLYQITCDLIQLCEQHHILWSCENPGRSFMWQTTSFVTLFASLQCLSTEFHHCMFGSSRRKLTRLIHNVPSFHQLHHLCDNQHEHEPWGQRPDGSWATSEETAYPWPLARAIAAQVLLQLQEFEVQCHPPSFAQQEATLQAMRASTDIQPRKHLPPLVPEFKQISTQAHDASLPPYSRKLSTPKRGQIASAIRDHVTVGVHFSPEEFVAEALSLRHPTEQQSLFPREVKENVAYLSKSTIHEVAMTRTERIREWTSYAIDHDYREKSAKAVLSHRIASVLKDKRLGLLDKLIKDSGHEDVTLVDDLAKGFDLTGSLPPSGVFSHKFRPASMTCDDLRKVSELSKSVIIESLQSSGDHDLDVGLYEATLKEVEKGFLEGPIHPSSLPLGSTLTKRFPVKQKNKVRPIDDYKASLVNFAVTQSEGVTIHNIDHIASMTALWMRSGSLISNDPLVAKCWDLSDAYKQVPLSDNAFELDSYLVVYDPSSKEAKVFKQRVLPFGSIASVTAFLRVSLAIWKIGSSLLHLMWSAYFDDFLCLARTSESRHVEFCASSVFSLLGWKVSTHKLLPFDSICKVLGVQLDLKQSGDSLCLISNTPERVEELAQEINLILSSGVLPKSDGEKLRGRLQFASSQVFGRKFRRQLKVLSNHVTMGRKVLTESTKCCLEEVVALLNHNVPRRVVATQADVLHVYVDASFNEVGYSGIGGLVIDMLGAHLSFFSAKVEMEMISSIVTRGQRTIIQELEMLAVLCAFKCWQKESAIHRVVLFTDSESVRGAFLKNWSANHDSDKLLESIFQIESTFNLPVWIERVPSQSNPADLLSREVITEFGDAAKIEVDPWEMWNETAK